MSAAADSAAGLARAVAARPDRAFTLILVALVRAHGAAGGELHLIEGDRAVFAARVGARSPSQPMTTAIGATARVTLFEPERPLPATVTARLLDQAEAILAMAGHAVPSTALDTMRSPLLRVRGYLELLEGTELDATQAEWVGEARAGAAALAERLDALQGRVPATATGR